MIAKPCRFNKLEAAMFQYYYDSKRMAWIVILDGHEIRQFKTEAEAKQFCAGQD
jgi:hypothetical protein